MGKYEPFAQFLGGLEQDSWTGTFEQIESKLGFALPKSAAEYRAWWSNQKGPGHSQKEAWQAAGWITSDVDLAHRTVRFERARNGTTLTNPSRQGRRDELMAQAREMSGIGDDDELIDAALLALIRREAGRKLIALGGTMPDAWTPARERPSL